jgi:hypothetical protein
MCNGVQGVNYLFNSIFTYDLNSSFNSFKKLFNNIEYFIFFLRYINFFKKNNFRFIIILHIYLHFINCCYII